MKLGVLTYPLYLIHQNIGFIVFHEIGDSVNRYVLLGALVLIMMLAAWLIHKLIEQPLGRWMNVGLNQLWDKFGISGSENKKPVSQVL